MRSQVYLAAATALAILMLAFTFGGGIRGMAS
jgi:hypothetical protein